MACALAWQLIPFFSSTDKGFHLLLALCLSCSQFVKRIPPQSKRWSVGYLLFLSHISAGSTSHMSREGAEWIDYRRGGHVHHRLFSFSLSSTFQSLQPCSSYSSSATSPILLIHFLSYFIFFVLSKKSFFFIFHSQTTESGWNPEKNGKETFEAKQIKRFRKIVFLVWISSSIADGELRRRVSTIPFLYLIKFLCIASFLTFPCIPCCINCCQTSLSLHCRNIGWIPERYFSFVAHLRFQIHVKKRPKPTEAASRPTFWPNLT